MAAPAELNPAHCNAFWETPIYNEYYGTEHICTEAVTVDGKTCERHRGFYRPTTWLREVTKYRFDLEGDSARRTVLRKKHVLFALTSGRVTLQKEHNGNFPFHFYPSDGSKWIHTHYLGYSGEYQTKYSELALYVFQTQPQWQREWFELLWRRAVRFWYKKLTMEKIHSVVSPRSELWVDVAHLIQTPQDAYDIFNISKFDWFHASFVYQEVYPRYSVSLTSGGQWQTLVEVIFKKFPHMAADTNFREHVINQVTTSMKSKDTHFIVKTTKIFNVFFYNKASQFYNSIKYGCRGILAEEAAHGAWHPKRIGHIVNTYGITGLLQWDGYEPLSQVA